MSIKILSPLFQTQIGGGLPVIIRCNPQRGQAGDTLDVIIVGRFFTGASDVDTSSVYITVNSFTVDSDYQITANFTIDAAAAPGLVAVDVTNAQGTTRKNEIFEIGAADVQTARPTGAGAETSIDTVVPSTSQHWQEVLDVTPDDDTGYVENKNGAAGGWQRDLYTIGSLDHIGFISKVKVYVRSKHNVSDVKASIRTDGETHDSPALGGQSDWTTLSNTWTTNPATGSPWTWGEIDNLQIGVSLQGSTASPDWSRCTQVYVEVYYST